MSYWILEKKGESAASGRSTATHKGGLKSVQTTLHGYAKPSTSSVSETNRIKRKRSIQDNDEKANVEDADVSPDTSTFGRAKVIATVDVSLYSSEESGVSDMERTPIKRTVKRRRKRWGDAACAPAISPRKRKSLIEQSAKDVAAQQDRQRSSRKPLLTIENISEPSVNLSPSSSQQRERSLSEATPSPLRKGFSIVQVNAFSDVESDEDVQSSPLMNKSSSPIGVKALRISAPDDLPRRRILARETQLPNFASHDNQSDEEIAQPSERQGQIDIPNSFDSSQTIPETFFGEGEQTLSFAADSVLSKPVASPQSDVDGDLTIMPEPFEYGDGRAADLDDHQTQLLPWEDEGAAAVLDDKNDVGDACSSADDDEATSPTRIERRTRSWMDIDRLWSGHLGEDAALKSRQRAAATASTARQSHLQLHGFSKQIARHPAARSPSPMSEGEDVPSDIDEVADVTHHDASTSPANKLVVERADFVRPFSGNDVVDNATDSSETQSLPWDDEHSDHSQRVDQSINIPSDSGLDTQMRQFFEQL